MLVFVLSYVSIRSAPWVSERKSSGLVLIYFLNKPADSFCRKEKEMLGHADLILQLTSILLPSCSKSSDKDLERPMKAYPLYIVKAGLAQPQSS